MSVEALTAPRSESDKDAKKEILSQAERDAFASIAENEDIDTQAIIDDEKQKAIESQQLAKLAELDEHLKDTDDRRRGIKAIYNSELADSMTDAEIESFIAERLAPAELKAQIAPEIEKTAETTKRAPEGFPTKEDYLADLESEGPVKIGFWKKARLLMGAPGRAVWKGYSKLFQSAAERQEKYETLSPEERKKLKRRNLIISSVSALAIGGAMAAWKLDHASFGGGNTIHDPALNPDEVVDPKEHQGGASSVNTLAEQQRLNEAQFIYSPETDPFNNPDKKDWNFRAALDTSSVEAAIADLTEGWKHNPLQFATAMGALGMIPNNQASIEGVAQQMLDSPSLFATNHAAAMDIVGSSNAHFVEGSYNAHGSYSMVAGPNGVQQLAYDSNVVDPQMMLVFNSPSGLTAFGCDCGQSSEIAVAPAPAPTYVETVPAIGGASYVWQPEQPTGGYTPPQDTYTPPGYTPPQDTYTPPGYTPPQDTYTPPTYTPPEHKGNEYPSNQWDVPLDSGTLMPTPVPVETETVTQPSRDIGGGVQQDPIVDTVTAPRGAETGGQMTEGSDTLDTSSNTDGPTRVQAPESTATNNTEVDSSL
jgi:hypothetical protein